MSSSRVVLLPLLLCTLCSGPSTRAGLHVPPQDSMQAKPDDYRWPIEGARIVTSTFGEYRHTHFHAGIDISTGDATDYRVTAARGGYVSRIRVTPVGYGKILYVRHQDGFTTTYAHLARFAPSVEARARAEQQKAGRYPVDIECAKGEFPVHTGDLIAFSGQSGARSPHLHFEIHDEQGNPVNPFLFPPLRVHDTIAPNVRAIALKPLHPGSTVDGSSEVCIYRLLASRNGTAAIRDPIVVTGEVGFSVDARDRIPGSRFTNGVYAETLMIDSTVCFATRLDRTPWQEPHEIGLCYERAPHVGRNGRFAKLYMDSPNHLPFYSPHSDRPGMIDEGRFALGPHSFRIVCSDFSGNSAVVAGTLIVSRAPGFTARGVGDSLVVHLFDPSDVKSIRVAVRLRSGPWSDRAVSFPKPVSPEMTIPLMRTGEQTARVQVENRWGTLSAPRFLPGALAHNSPGSLHLSCETGAEYVEIRAKSEEPLTEPPVVVVEEGSMRSHVVMSALDADEFIGWVQPRESYRGTRHVVADASNAGGRSSATADFALYPIVPGTHGSISFDRGRLEVIYDSLSVLKPLLLQVTKSAGDEGPLYELSPGDVVLGDGLTVTIVPDSTRPHQGLFARGRGDWELIGSPRRGDAAGRSGRVSGTLGEVALLVDDTAPVIGRVTITQHAGGRPRIEFRYRDDLSGIEYDDLKMYIDGAMVIPEIDGLRHRVLHQVQEPLARGSHQLTIRLFDRMGNSSTAERRFVLR